MLIDGVRYSSMTIGTPALYLIPADQIDRIEILYGASGASLYGADAMGGVIQIFTKGQNAQQSNVALTIGGGTQNSYKGQITGQYVNDTSTLSLSTGYEKTDGINATRPDVGSNYFADKDGNIDQKMAGMHNTIHIEDNDNGVAKLTSVAVLPDPKAAQQLLDMGVEEGMNSTFDNLETLLETL